MIDESSASSIAGKWIACCEAGFPLCLDDALTAMFGNNGKNVPISVVKRIHGRLPPAKTPKEVWALFESYVKSWRKSIGNDSTEVIEYQVKKQIELMGCIECPVYQKTLIDYANCTQ